MLIRHAHPACSSGMLIRHAHPVHPHFVRSPDHFSGNRSAVRRMFSARRAEAASIILPW